MRVVILRHSTAVDPYAAPTDETRWLTAEGRARARRVGALLKGELSGARRIFASPLVRAMQTADLIAEAIGFEGPVVTHPPLAAEYGTTAQALSALEQCDEKETVLLVSHAPKVRVLAAHLSGQSTMAAFRTCSACAIDVVPSGGGRVAFWIDPSGPEVLPAPPS